MSSRRTAQPQDIEANSTEEIPAFKRKQRTVCADRRLTIGITALVLLGLALLSRRSDRPHSSGLTEDDVHGVRMARAGEKVLVTGGLGFIGSHVIELLLDRRFPVIVLDDESNGHNHNAKAAETFVPRDISVISHLPLAQTGVTHLVHLAAAISVAESMKLPAKYERVNINGSQNVLDWADANRIRRVVAASSAAIYGNPDPSLLPLKETAGYGGLSPYADTKCAGPASGRCWARGVLGSPAPSHVHPTMSS